MATWLNVDPKTAINLDQIIEIVTNHDEKTKRFTVRLTNGQTTTTLTFTEGDKSHAEYLANCVWDYISENAVNPL